MYQIDSHYELPDIEYMEKRANELMAEGIAVKNLRGIYNNVAESQRASAKNIKELYNINNPNNFNDILNYFQSIINEDIVEACCRNGKWTTDKNALGDLALKGYQEAIDILTYRKAAKYTQSIANIIDNLCSDGRLRPKVSLGKTNRINYSEPPLMNIPKALLWHIIAPRTEGNIIISVDIKNQEPWIMINMLNIVMLKQILEEEGSEGLYEAVFHRIFDRPCTPIERTELKIAWNAMTYGATVYGIKEICRHCDGERIYKFFSQIPEYKQYWGKCYGRSKKRIQKAETYFGTELYADALGSKLQRILMDIPIQGTGSDILALLIRHFDEEIEARELEDYLSLYYTRHDELIIEADRSYVKQVGMDHITSILADIFEHRIDDWEPFKVKIGEVKAPDLFIEGTIFQDEEDD